MAGAVRIGTSGWAYKSWRGDFYPKGLRQRDELAHLAGLMSSVEINGSFYSLQRASSYRSWVEQTPEDFVFAVKGSRYVTHLLQLREPAQALANFFASGVLELRHKLGPVLWQLPARTRFDPDRLAAFFDLLPRTTKAVAELAADHDERVKDPALDPYDDRPVRHVVEVRHDSFRDPAFPALLRDHGIGLVVSDGAGEWVVLDDVTSDVVYVRLHGPEVLYHGGYDDALLDAWADRVRHWSGDAVGADVYVYFDNDADRRAPHDALALMERLR
ncbi:DUF72 domain-containing protein [Nocardioides sp. TF02-7]|uniref:DUF72 domain-containing protein n=1 Tax=Nocardioides sp. TF02-7 TaxID=2917724 RepID=UPI001F0511B8|nr:DUF72 domain-containing protein [Nocardioides sp. TF02-7]UMG93079.1 DUF72 domain-containing protein [Nocardioides sp. TF02-7]